MSCVMYLTHCYKCKHEEYDRYKHKDCTKCKSENVGYVVEWDEKDDHHDYPTDGWGSDE